VVTKNSQRLNAETAAADTDIPIDHAPKQFAKEIKEAMDHLRLHVRESAGKLHA
jgi:hypothetical protein